MKMNVKTLVICNAMSTVCFSVCGILFLCQGNMLAGILFSVAAVLQAVNAYLNYRKLHHHE